MKNVKRKKLGRRILSFILSAVLVVGLMPGNVMTVSAEDTATVSADEWLTEDGNTVTIDGTLGGKTTATEDDITALVEAIKGYVDRGITTIIVTGSKPAMIDMSTYTMTAIGEAIYRLSGSGTYDAENPYNGKIDLVLSDVTEIVKWEFESAYALNSIEIPDSVTAIGYGAFISCVYLTSIEIPEGVTTIPDSAFYGCNSLTGITIPDSVTSIGTTAFYECNSLTDITIPDSVTTIEGSAFRYCTSLTSITIPDSVTSIGEMAFHSCESLTYITIPDSVTSIGIMAFKWCDSLTDITIPASVTSIGDGAFDECESLATVNVSCKWDGTLYTFDEGVTVNKVVHSWTNGTCTDCGAVCGHSDATKVTYAAEGATITMSCSECGLTGTAIISATGKTYDGAAFEATVEKTGTLKDSDIPVTYTAAEGSALTEDEPVNAGTYTASITLGEGDNAVTASVEFTIEKATLDLGEVTADTLENTLNISDVNLSCTNKTVDGVLILAEDTVLKYGTHTYNWVFTPTDTTNYNQATGTVEITINDTIEPVISGVENGKVYCEAQTITVTDANVENLTVTINGTPVTLEADGTYVLSGDGTKQTIVASDGTNTTTREVTVYSSHPDENADGMCDACNTRIAYLIAVTSRLLGTTDTVTNISMNPSNGYANAEDGVTVTAQDMLGYTFKGWYLATDLNAENQITEGTEAQSTSFTYTFTPNADVTLVAVYEAAGKADVTFSGSNFTVSVDGGEASSSQDGTYTSQLAIGSEVTITVTDESFINWLNENKKIVTTESTYTFTVTGDVTLTMSKKGTAGQTAMVEFVSAYNQVIASQTYDSDDTIVFPDGPSKMGYIFTVWSLTEEEIHTKITEGETHITVTPVYEQDTSVTYTVTVYVDGEQDDTQTATGILPGSSKIVNAPAIDGKVFLYWTDGEDNILGYSTSYGMWVNKNVVVKAVYGEEEVDEKPVIAMTNVFTTSLDDKNKISFSVTRDIPDGYTLVEHGMLYNKLGTITNPSEDTFILGETGVSKYVSTSTELFGVFTLNVNMTGAEDVKVVARGYMIVKDSTGKEEIYYTDIAYNSYSEMSN